MVKYYIHLKSGETILVNADDICYSIESGIIVLTVYDNLGVIGEFFEPVGWNKADILDTDDQLYI